MSGTSSYKNQRAKDAIIRSDLDIISVSRMLLCASTLTDCPGVQCALLHVVEEDPTVISHVAQRTVV